MSENQKSEATFIGKGIEKNGRIQCTMRVDEAEAFIFTYEGKRYIKFNVVPLATPDKFGKTHTMTCFEYEEKQTADANEPQVIGYMHQQGPGSKPKTTRKPRASKAAKK
jgi:hypothetical protein